MAVLQAGTPNHYTGLSTDDKSPVAANGSTFHAVDTGEEWIFHDGMWSLDLRRARAMQLAP